MILEAIAAAGYKPGKDVSLALDVAASRVPRGQSKYVFKKSRRRSQDARTEHDRDVLEDWASDVPDRLDRGRPRRERLGRLEAA